MTITDLTLDRSISGNIGTPAAAIGAPDGTFTTTSGDIGWTHQWGFQEQPPGNAAGTMTMDVVLRKQPVGASGTASLSGRVLQDGTLIHMIPTLALQSGVHTRSVTILGIRPSGVITVELTGVESGGGNPNSRCTPGIDAVTLHYDYAEAQGSAFKGWDGSGWQDGFLKKWDGSAWVPAFARRWTGTQWELVP